MRDNRRMQRFGIYTCLVCGKRTRETGLGEEGCELCAYCFEESGLENSLSDGAITHEEFESELAALKVQYKR